MNEKFNSNICYWIFLFFIFGKLNISVSFLDTISQMQEIHYNIKTTILPLFLLPLLLFLCRSGIENKDRILHFQCDQTSCYNQGHLLYLASTICSQQSVMPTSCRLWPITTTHSSYTHVSYLILLYFSFQTIISELFTPFLDLSLLSIVVINRKWKQLMFVTTGDYVPVKAAVWSKSEPLSLSDNIGDVNIVMLCYLIVKYMW